MTLKKSTQDLIKAKYPVHNPKRIRKLRRGTVEGVELAQARHTRAKTLKLSRNLLGRKKVAKGVLNNAKTKKFKKLSESMRKTYAKD